MARVTQHVFLSSVPSFFLDSVKPNEKGETQRKGYYTGIIARTLRPTISWSVASSRLHANQRIAVRASTPPRGEGFQSCFGTGTTLSGSPAPGRTLAQIPLSCCFPRERILTPYTGPALGVKISRHSLGDPGLPDFDTHPPDEASSATVNGHVSCIRGI